MKIELSGQVVDFVRRLPPEPRRQLRQALRDLGKEKGDIKRLEGPLDGYCRLRVGDYRVIVFYTERRSIQCIFAERRSIVYEVFAAALKAALSRAKSKRACVVTPESATDASADRRRSSPHPARSGA